jgi:hypothetical protein
MAEPAPLPPTMHAYRPAPSRWKWVGVALVLVGLVGGVVWLIGPFGKPAVAPNSAIRVTPQPVEFGSQTVGTTSGVRAVIVSDQDRGGAAMSIKDVTMAGTDTGDFSVASTSCRDVRVPAGQSCSIDVSFGPAAVGARYADVVINLSDADQSLSVTVTGEGVVSPLAADPSGVTFGQIAVGATSTAQTVTMTNDGAQPLVVQQATLAGEDMQDFAFQAVAAGCSGVTLNPGSRCAMTVTFTPEADGDRDASLVFTYIGTGSPTSVGLDGAGAPLKLRVAPTRMNFGLQALRSASNPMAVTLSTPLGTVVPVGAVTVTGPDAPEFSLVSNACTGVTLPPRDSCTVMVIFTPTNLGTQLAAVNVYRADEITLAGTVQLKGFGSAK